MYIKLRKKLYNITNFRDIKWEANDLSDSTALAIITVTFNETITHYEEGFPILRSILIDLDNSCYGLRENGEESQLENYVNHRTICTYDKNKLLAILYNTLMEKAFNYITDRIALKEEVIDITEVVDNIIHELITG